MAKYDKAITVFAPDGQLFQVQYAFEAVNRGSATIAVTGSDCIVLAVEKTAVAKLQDVRTIRKIVPVDDHLMITFAGLQADARILIDKARLECQSFRYQYEDSPSIEYMARFVSMEQQKYTQKGGVRPYGISTFLCGFQDNKPQVFLTEPSGAMSQWKANAIGKKSKELREFLEEKFGEGLNEAQAIRLGIETLLEVVESEKSIELCVIRGDNVSRFVPSDDI
jgi:20S proteasome subunit alpha 4